jgi:hypothetical protein
VAKLISFDAAVAARCLAPGWLRWARCSRDGLAHVFLIEEQRGWWPQAVSAYTVASAALDPATVVGPRCVLALAATDTALGHRRPDAPRERAWLLTWWPRHRHDHHSPLCARARGITLPPTTAQPAPRDGQTSRLPGPGAAWSHVLAAPPMRCNTKVPR